MVDDSPLTDTPPHILVSVNTLCQDDEYIVAVIFGTRPIGTVKCEFQLPNLTIRIVKPSFDVQIDVPADVVGGTGYEYCYFAVLHVV